MSTSQFKNRVLSVVRRIPVGRVATYGDVATLAGRPRAWRTVGAIMCNCRMPGIPCHRVVGAGGRLGGYSDPSIKRGLLRAERVRVFGFRLPDFAGVRWNGSR